MIRCKKSGVIMNTKASLIRLTSVLLIVLGWSIPAFCGEIHDAARSGDLEKVKMLLNDNPELVSSKDDFGQTPLHKAMVFDRKDAVALLLTKKADVNARDYNGFTPLHCAAISGNIGIVKLLLANKADVNAKDNLKGTPLRWAASYRHKDAVELLRQHGGHE
jgi:uncharacterized protein